MKNREIAGLFEKIGDVLEFKGENIFKVNAYRKAARILDDLTEDIAVVAEQERLRDIPGIGEGISKDILDYLKNGKMEKFEIERKGVPDGIFQLLSISGLGPKTVSLIYKQLGIKSVQELELAIKNQKLRDLPGMGAKKEENILRGIQILREGSSRMNIGIALPLVSDILTKLRELKEVKDLSPAGSFRRMKETIGDIDILATGTKNEKIIDYFTHLPMVKEILGAGDTKASVRIEGNLQVDLRVVEEDSFGAALQYFTGSKEHNVHLREIAKKEGFKINEYGVFKGEKKVAGKTEQEVYAVLGLPYIPPEIREDRGEIEAAFNNSLPDLIDVKDIQGDFHVHTNWSDGKCTIEEVIQAAKQRGYKFIGITDHSGSLNIANGLSPQKLQNQIREIRKTAEKIKGITVFAGSEVDIKADGTMDFSDELLRQLDFVIASIHIGFKKDEQTNTNRMITAIKNPFVTLVAHPTGRLLGERDPYALNLDEVMQAAKETGTAMEINSSYHRLDLNDIHARKAHDMGLTFAIDTDSHHTDQLWQMQLGIGVARRAWISSKEVLNTWSVKQIQEFRQKKIKNSG